MTQSTAARLSTSRRGMRTGWSLHQREVGLAWLLLTPVLLVMALLLVWPFATSVWISFTNKSVGTAGDFVGFANFQALLASPRFFKALQNSLVFTVSAVTAKYILGMLMALILNQAFRGRNVLRALFLVPWVLPGFVAYINWRWLYDPLQGVLSYALTDLHIVDLPIDFLSNPDVAMVSVIIADVWRGFPFFGLSLLAGLQNIPQEQYEAAAVDGANSWQRFRAITLPGLRYVSLVVLMLATIWTFNAFEPIYILTKGGPADATLVYTMLAYETGIQSFDLGRASAVSVFILPVLGLFIVVLSGLMHRGED
jgi:ABC-type sugar transport system permease subunit